MLPECLTLRSRCIPEIEARSSAPDNWHSRTGAEASHDVQEASARVTARLPGQGQRCPGRTASRIFVGERGRLRSRRISAEDSFSAHAALTHTFYLRLIFAYNGLWASHGKRSSRNRSHASLP